MKKFAFGLCSILFGSSVLFGSVLPEGDDGISLTQLKLAKGWNMVSSPTNGSIEIADLKKKHFQISSVFGFDGSAYTSPTKLEVGKGYWLKSSEDVNVVAENIKYNENGFAFSKTSTGFVSGKWNLIGTPTTTTKDAIKKALGTSAVWYFDTKANSYSTNENIGNGSGFWTK